MSDSGTFQINSVIQKSELAAKCSIHCIEFYKQSLFIGDEKGNIYSFNTKISNGKVELEDVKSNKPKNVSKQRIQQMKVLKSSGQVIVLSDNEIFSVDWENLSRSNLIKNVKADDFTFNESPFHFNQILIIHDQEGTLHSLDAEGRLSDWRLKDNQITFSKAPQCVAFSGKYIVTWEKKEYNIYNIEKGFERKEIELKSDFPFIKVLDDTELLLNGSIQNSFFFSFEGVPKRGTLSYMLKKDIIGIITYQIYLIILYSNSEMHIYNLQECSQIQEIQLNIQEPSSICINSKNIFASSSSEIIFLYQIQYTDVISQFIKIGNPEEALAVFEKHIPRDDVTRPQQYEQYKIDAVWSCLFILDFEKAKTFLIEQNQRVNKNFDMREILVLFPDLLPQKDREGLLSLTNKAFFSDIIYEYLFNQQIKKEEYTRMEMDAGKNSKFFLLRVLELYREQEITLINSGKDEALQQQLQFIVSPHSQSAPKFPPITRLDMMEIVDYALIKLFLQISNIKDQHQDENGSFNSLSKLNNFLLKNANGSLFCRNVSEDIMNNLEHIANADRENNWQLKARFSESILKFQQAIDVWMEIANEFKAKSIMCATECVRIMGKSKNQQLIIANLSQIFQIDFGEACQFFKLISDPQYGMLEIIGENEMLHIMEEPDFFQDQDQEHQAKEKFLETRFDMGKIKEQENYTRLAFFYIDSMYMTIPQENQIPNKESLDNKDIVTYRKQLDQILTMDPPLYTAKIVYDKIKNSWLLREEIFLFEKMNNFDSAIIKMLERSQYEMAEVFCEKHHEEKLLSKLFVEFQKRYMFHHDFLEKKAKVFQEIQKKVSVIYNTIESNYQQIQQKQDQPAAVKSTEEIKTDQQTDKEVPSELGNQLSQQEELIRQNEALEQEEEQLQSERELIKQQTIENEQKKKFFELQMMHLMRKYYDNPSLDPILVLEAIPDHWVLDDSDINQNVVPFFISTTLNKSVNNRRMVKANQHISEMDFLDTSAKLIEIQRAHIKVSSKRKCAVCDQFIQYKIFVVYPNGVICHRSCVKDLKICPKTNYNFQINYQG